MTQGDGDSRELFDATADPDPTVVIEVPDTLDRRIYVFLNNWSYGPQTRPDMERELRALIAKRQWQPIETAPRMTAWVIDGVVQAPQDALVFFGGMVHVARVARLPDGELMVRVAHVAGNVADECSHWMSLPEPPK